MLVNKSRIASLLGENATPAEMDAKIAEIEQLVSSATGFSKPRGDQIKVAAVSFVDDGGMLQPVPSPPLSEILMRQFGTVVNALTILALCAMMIWFGLRPAVRMLDGTPSGRARAAAGAGCRPGCREAEEALEKQEAGSWLSRRPVERRSRT